MFILYCHLINLWIAIGQRIYLISDPFESESQRVLPSVVYEIYFTDYFIIQTLNLSRLKITVFYSICVRPRSVGLLDTSIIDICLTIPNLK